MDPIVYELSHQVKLTRTEIGCFNETWVAVQCLIAVEMLINLVIVRVRENMYRLRWEKGRMDGWMDGW